MEIKSYKEVAVTDGLNSKSDLERLIANIITLIKKATDDAEDDAKSIIASMLLPHFISEIMANIVLNLFDSGIKEEISVLDKLATLKLFLKGVEEMTMKGYEMVLKRSEMN